MLRVDMRSIETIWRYLPWICLLLVIAAAISTVMDPNPAPWLTPIGDVAFIGLVILYVIYAVQHWVVGNRGVAIGMLTLPLIAYILAAKAFMDPVEGAALLVIAFVAIASCAGIVCSAGDRVGRMIRERIDERQYRYTCRSGMVAFVAVILLSGVALTATTPSYLDQNLALIFPSASLDTAMPASPLQDRSEIPTVTDQNWPPEETGGVSYIPAPKIARPPTARPIVHIPNFNRPLIVRTPAPHFTISRPPIIRPFNTIPTVNRPQTLRPFTQLTPVYRPPMVVTAAPHFTINRPPTVQPILIHTAPTINRPIMPAPTIHQPTIIRPATLPVTYRPPTQQPVYTQPPIRTLGTPIHLPRG